MKLSVAWLKDYVKIPTPLVGAANRLTMAGLEVEKIHPSTGKGEVFEVEVTTNRPDWLSHVGVARELAATLNLKLVLPKAEPLSSRKLPEGWSLNVKDPEGCPFYTGVLIEGIQWNPTPAFIKDRLVLCGLRSINIIVDITNYVLLETGQPLHAFDADLIAKKKIHVRRAKEGEKIQAIDGSEYDLKRHDLVIADHEKSVAIAGIMGGAETEVSNRTRSIFLESAFFDSRSIRRTSLRLGLSSDSSYRFERRVDPQGVVFASQRAVSLIKQYAKPMAVSSMIKQGECPVTNRSAVRLKKSYLEKVLGVVIPVREVTSILRRLGLSVEAQSEGWQVKIPSFRVDLTRPIDLVEEVARLYGFDRIPSTLPSFPPLNLSENPKIKMESTFREILVGSGLYETVTFSLTAPMKEQDMSEAVRIVNPQNKDLCWMRPSLLGSLLEVAGTNDRLQQKRIPLFEIANTYSRPMEGKRAGEETVIGILLTGQREQKNWLAPLREYSFYDIKGLVTNLLQAVDRGEPVYKREALPFFKSECSESLWVNDKKIGQLGEVDLKWVKEWGLEKSVFFAQLSVDALQALVPVAKMFQPSSRYPAIERDMALIVSDTVKAADIEEIIRKEGSSLIRDVQVFDIFQGGRIPKGHKNIAFRIRYQSHEKTLISEDIQNEHTQMAKKVVEKFQATFQTSS